MIYSASTDDWSTDGATDATEAPTDGLTEARPGAQAGAQVGAQVGAQAGALPFAGLTVIVTGEVDGLTRFSANDAIARLGGKPVTSVSGKTGLVIVGEGAGVSKMHKTRLHRLNVIDGPALAALAANPSSWDGQPVGEPVADYEARLAAASGNPEPDPEPQVPLHERHLVSKATCYPRVGASTMRQVRMSCSCGHRWLSTNIHEPFECPVEAGTTTEAATTPPWHGTLAPAPTPAPTPAPEKTSVPEPGPASPERRVGEDGPGIPAWESIPGQDVVWSTDRSGDWDEPPAPSLTPGHAEVLSGDWPFA